jgi:hypothetical protein
MQNPITAAVVAKGPSGLAPLEVDSEGSLKVVLTETPSPPVGPAYVACPASATTALGGAGALGDELVTLTIIPATLSPGAVQIKDGSAGAITVFEGGATTLADISSFTLTFNMPSKVGGWEVICGANVSAIAVGVFA